MTAKQLRTVVMQEGILAPHRAADRTLLSVIAVLVDRLGTVTGTEEVSISCRDMHEAMKRVCADKVHVIGYIYNVPAPECDEPGVRIKVRS
jgi:hypothetical protein